MGFNKIKDKKFKADYIYMDFPIYSIVCKNDKDLLFQVFYLC